MTDCLAEVHSTDDGASAVEYGIVVSLIAAVIAVIVGTLGSQVAALFASIPIPWVSP